MSFQYRYFSRFYIKNAIYTYFKKIKVVSSCTRHNPVKGILIICWAINLLIFVKRPKKENTMVVVQISVTTLYFNILIKYMYSMLQIMLFFEIQSIMLSLCKKLYQFLIKCFGYSSSLYILHINMVSIEFYIHQKKFVGHSGFTEISGMLSNISNSQHKLLHFGLSLYNIYFLIKHVVNLQYTLYYNNKLSLIA